MPSQLEIRTYGAYGALFIMCSPKCWTQKRVILITLQFFSIFIKCYFYFSVFYNILMDFQFFLCVLESVRTSYQDEHRLQLSLN